MQTFANANPQIFEMKDENQTTRKWLTHSSITSSGRPLLGTPDTAQIL